jgi:hypothetical protein
MNRIGEERRSPPGYAGISAALRAPLMRSKAALRGPLHDLLSTRRALTRFGANKSLKTEMPYAISGLYGLMLQAFRSTRR